MNISNTADRVSRGILRVETIVIIFPLTIAAYPAAVFFAILMVLVAGGAIFTPEDFKNPVLYFAVLLSGIGSLLYLVSVNILSSRYLKQGTEALLNANRLLRAPLLFGPFIFPLWVVAAIGSAKPLSEFEIGLLFLPTMLLALPSTHLYIVGAAAKLSRRMAA